MKSNVIAFAARTVRAANDNRAVAHPLGRPGNVVSLAAWLDRAIPRRTPNGVFFTTRVLATTGDFA